MLFIILIYISQNVPKVVFFFFILEAETVSFPNPDLKDVMRRIFLRRNFMNDIFTTSSRLSAAAEAAWRDTVSAQSRK